MGPTLTNPTSHLLEARLCQRCIKRSLCRTTDAVNSQKARCHAIAGGKKFRLAPAYHRKQGAHAMMDTDGDGDQMAMIMMTVMMTMTTTALCINSCWDLPQRRQISRDFLGAVRCEFPTTET